MTFASLPRNHATAPDPGRTDTVIRTAVFDSLGVSQGGELTQQYALRLFAGMFPVQSAAIAKRLQDNPPGLRGSVWKRMNDFAESDLHGFTPDKVGGGLAVSGSLKWLLDAVEEGPVSPAGLEQRALYLGSAILRRDYRFAGHAGRRKKSESPTYGLYSASHNSHFLHYAYITSPRDAAPESVTSSASYAARTFADALETGDINTLEAVDTAQVTIRYLRAATATHLDYYQEHARLIPDAFMDNVMGDNLFRQLPKDSLRPYPEPACLPK